MFYRCYIERFKAPIHLHILIVPSWYRASKADTQGSFFREQAFALYKAGHQVGIVHPQHRSMRQWQSTFTGKYGFDIEDDNGIPTLRMHTMTWFPRQIPYLNYWLWVRNGIALYEAYVSRYGAPDVVHAHATLYGGLLAWTIQQRYQIPFAITEHGTAYARNLFAPWELKMAAKAVAAADARLAVSEAFCQEISRFIGSQWQPCANVVPESFTTYPLALTKQAKATEINETKPFVFTTVAYLSVRKGIHHLITAFASAFGGDKTARLKIGGDGGERDRLEALAAELNISDQVVFLGALDREAVREAIAQTDVFVLASQYETFGVVVIEALALGKPVIATRCGGPNQVVQSQDGLLIEPENVPALTQALQHMRDRADEYDAKTIRQNCIARFGEQALVDRLLPIYEEISGLQDRTQSRTQNNAAKDLAPYA